MAARTPCGDDAGSQPALGRHYVEDTLRWRQRQGNEPVRLDRIGEVHGQRVCERLGRLLKPNAMLRLVGLGLRRRGIQPYGQGARPRSCAPAQPFPIGPAFRAIAANT
jgi:hypothetical protein